MALSIRTAAIVSIAAVDSREGLAAGGIEDHVTAPASARECDGAVGICAGNGDGSGRCSAGSCYGHGYCNGLAGCGGIRVIGCDRRRTRIGRDGRHGVARTSRTAGIVGISAVYGCQSPEARGVEDHITTTGFRPKALMLQLLSAPLIDTVPVGVEPLPFTTTLTVTACPDVEGSGASAVMVVVVAFPPVLLTIDIREESDHAASHAELITRSIPEPPVAAIMTGSARRDHVDREISRRARNYRCHAGRQVGR